MHPSPRADKTRKLLLVDPYPRNNPYHLTAAERRAVWFPKLSLPVIAAYTPPGWDVALVDEAGREMHPVGGRPWTPHRGWILERVLDRPALVATSAVLVQRQLFEAVGGFNESLLRCHDLDLWMRLAGASPASVVALPLAQWRQHMENQRIGGLDVLGYRMRIYEGLLARSPSRRVRRLCRRQRIRVSLDFIRGMSGAGRHAEARRALALSFPYAGGHPGWWMALLQTWLRPLAGGRR